MCKIAGFVLLVIGMSTALMATPPAPEIDASTGATAITLLSGVVLVLRGQRKK